jgi:hypothetical protein
VLGLGWATKVGGTIIPVKAFVTRTVSDPEGLQIVLVTQHGADNVSRIFLLVKGYVDVALVSRRHRDIHVNALAMGRRQRGGPIYL